MGIATVREVDGRATVRYLQSVEARRLAARWLASHPRAPYFIVAVFGLVLGLVVTYWLGEFIADVWG